MNISAYAIGWCKRWGVPERLWDDIIQEAHLAACEGADANGITRSMNRYRMSCYAIRDKEVPVTDLGLEYDQYHGWCRDDV